MRNNFAILLKKNRQEKGFMVKHVAQKLDVDSSLVSRFESGSRLPTERQVTILAQMLEIPLKTLMVPWLSSHIIKEYGKNEYFKEAIRVAVKQAGYKKSFVKSEYPKSLTQLIDKIDKLKKELNDLRAIDSQKIVEALEMEYTFSSNQIEGNTLTLQETSLVVKEGITVDGKSMREHLEAINHTDALAFVNDLVGKKAAITERNIMQLHELVLRGIDKQYAGRYRNLQVMITGSKHTPPAPYLVAKQMEDLILYYNENLNLHPVILAAEMHERLVSIHPFIDGNGRTSRLLMNLILLKYGYVIANIKGDKKNRLAYYNALESARLEKNKVSFLAFIAQTELECLERYISILK